MATNKMRRLTRLLFNSNELPDHLTFVARSRCWSKAEPFQSCHPCTPWETLCHVEKLNLFNDVTHDTHGTAFQKLLLRKNFSTTVKYRAHLKKTVATRHHLRVC